MNLLIDSAALDRIVFTANALYNRFIATLPSGASASDMVAAAMPAIIAEAVKPQRGGELPLA